MEVNFTWMWQYILSFCLPGNEPIKNVNSVFSQRILLLLKSTPFTEHSWLWAISGQFGSSPEIRVKILHLAGQSFSWKVFSSLNAQIKIQIVFTFFHINSTSSSLSTLQVSVPSNLPFVANPPEKPVCLHHVLQSPPTSVGSWWLLSARRWSEVLPISYF